MYRVCIILWDGAIIGVYTKEKIINTYPPLFDTLFVAEAQRAGYFLIFLYFIRICKPVQYGDVVANSVELMFLTQN